ncbi:MAG: ADP-ribosylglycohydrolase family protein [Oscillatoriaceae cyanobacterium Prado104]|jgi:ADP-ribosylglycohydrolase|nr:ADP-ribosylglycohydrolase family protein [Oscillatoriaceae cyanobacterium Prado104]
MSQKSAIVGCIIGTAIGDAIGLPVEGLSKRRQSLMHPKISGHHLFMGRGMVSDDTEHTCMVAQSLIVSGGNLQVFSQQLTMRFRWWLLGLPAGVGFATLRAILKLWLGFPAHSSGVFSAGNGPAMRSAIIGVCCGGDFQKMRELVRICTRITHTDVKAEYGALAVAIAAHLASQDTDILPQQYYRILTELLPAESVDFLKLIDRAAASAAQQQTAADFAAEMGFSRGISGYIYCTVPVVIQTWLRYQNNYRDGILEIIRCGGDTDTAAAILGGIIGARVSKNGIPANWVSNLLEWPRTIQWMEALGDRLAQVCETGKNQRALTVSIGLVLLRNSCFLVIILSHGFRRLLPPY